MPSIPPSVRARPGHVFHAHTKPETRHFWLKLSGVEGGRHNVEIHNINPEEHVDPRRRVVHKVNVKLMGDSRTPVLRVKPSESSGTLPEGFRHMTHGFLSMLAEDYELNEGSTSVAPDRKVAFIIGRRPGSKPTFLTLK